MYYMNDDKVIVVTIVIIIMYYCTTITTILQIALRKKLFCGLINYIKLLQSLIFVLFQVKESASKTLEL